ncbi:outer membrane beta-barrel protein [Sandaracinobacter sp. RS1-74]|uniref:OmpW/AlkL family protein n=1 Tax=Sandaracinobacteroides sayramensis TaxID=2913411 RepID=UPI001EDA6B2E|nr:OmpW family outer membrane protein [Sandaracinobacteroides sayramensis]MCG2842465.1 outer membrane beta-barrel protein [Sandaracinobacteroides sayramensis]
MKPHAILAMGVVAAAVAVPANAAAGDWILRARAIAVAPQDSSGKIQPAFPNEGVTVKTAYAPEVDITYMVTNNLGLELIAATTKHSAFGKTGTTGSIGKLVDTWVLPPTLTLQYHFMPEAKFRPYVGAGVNYTIFYNSRASGSLEDAVGETDVSLSNSFGWALQAGADVPINEKIFLNFDIKYIDIDTTARLNTTAIGQQRVRINIDPLVIGFGIGVRF